MRERPVAAAGGAVAAAVASALCCTGPLVAVAIGVSGAGLAVFQPFRPYLLGVTFAMLGVAHFLIRREERRACEPGTPCADPATRGRTRRIVWIATVLALLFAASPHWSAWLLS
ncbi:MAG: mercuric transporter MerT family protein [Gemmatimonadales bacterium]